MENQPLELMCPNVHCFLQNSPFGEIKSFFNSASVDQAISATGTVYDSTRKQSHRRITCHFSQSKSTLQFEHPSDSQHVLRRQKISDLKPGSNSMGWEGQLRRSQSHGSAFCLNCPESPLLYHAWGFLPPPCPLAFWLPNSVLTQCAL